MDRWDRERAAALVALEPAPRTSPALEEGRVHRESDRERCLVYLTFEGLDDTHHTVVGRSLERLTRRLWGSPALVPLGAAEFALLLDGWSVVRCQQLCGLLESAFEQGLRRLGEGVSMRVRVATVAGPKRTDCSTRWSPSESEPKPGS